MVQIVGLDTDFHDALTFGSVFVILHPTSDLEVVDMGASITLVIWGGRCSYVAFLSCGGSQLIYPSFPPTLIQGAAAIFFIMVAILFLQMAEGTAAHLEAIQDVLARKDKNVRPELNRWLRSMFAIFFIAADAMKNIRRATVPTVRNTKR